MKLLGLPPRRLASLGRHTAAAAWNLGMPFKATVATTFRCSCRCDFCGIWQRREEELPAAELVRNLAGLPSLAWVDISGGSLFMRRDYEELGLGMADGLPGLALVHFPTEGLHGDEAVHLSRIFARRGLRVVVTVSLDGPREVHDRLRGVPGLFDRATETLRRLRAEPGVDVYVGTTLLGDNLASVPHALFAAVSGSCPGLTPRDFHVNVMQRSGHYFDNASCPAPAADESAAALRRVRRWKGLPRGPFDLLELGYQSMALRVLEGGSVPRCAALRASFYLSPNGTVHPCHIWDRPLGRIGVDGTLAEILSSRAADDARTRIASRQCPQCWTPCEAYPTLMCHAANPLFWR